MATTLGGGATVDDRPLVRITGAGSDGYGRAPTVAGIGFQSGAPGLKLQACPQASIENCYARTAGTGFQVATHGDIRASSHLVEETRLVSPEGATQLLSFGEEWSLSG